MEKLILASCSPRRSELLTLAGIPFDAVSPDVDETCALSAGEAVAVLSARKAEAVRGGLALSGCVIVRSTGERENVGKAMLREAKQSLCLSFPQSVW